MLQPTQRTDNRLNKLRKKGLKPDVQTLEQYVEQCTVGLTQAESYLESLDKDTLMEPPSQIIRATHYLTFHTVHDWAGAFRRIGQSAIIGSYPACEPHRIERELSLLNLQMRELEEEETPELIRVAFYHARFERIHPFRDGNGRLGRLIMAQQTRSIFEEDVMLPRDRGEYFQALKKANKGDLTELRNFIGKSLGIRPLHETIMSPFRVAPLMLYLASPEQSLLQELEATRISSKNSQNN